jgi:nitroimidazol reductase NimA-like FMN-containing flavoprotein (pyridoxamine 5'-phosphate oxidase superfamily)
MPVRQSERVTPVPRSEQLAIPAEYGKPTELLDWGVVEPRLREARHYWLATVRADGRPHVVPLDGLWIDGRWYFGGSPGTVKHRNLLANPRVTLHLDGSESAVIVEGRCEIEQPTAQGAHDLVAASTAKYGYAPPVEAYLQGVWVLTPERALAWTDLTRDATRFLFE